MAVPLPHLEGLLRRAQRDLPAVHDSMQRRAALISSALSKDPTRATADHYTHRHKGQQWRCRVQVLPTGVLAHCLLWWLHGPKGRENQALDALLLRPDGLQALHFDSHFFGRWGLRSPLAGVHITNMMGFFKRYPLPPLRRPHRFYPAQPEFAAALDEGLLLARRNGKLILSCDTFKSLDMLSPEEQRLWQVCRNADGEAGGVR